jgi:hypothetical protein
MPEHVHLLVSEPRPDLFGGRTAPLKPKDGLNGPPSRSSFELRGEDSLARSWLEWGCSHITGRVRRCFGLHVFGYVVMPEHVHLLLGEPRLDLFSGRTAPLKPKDGLNGPPFNLHSSYRPEILGRVAHSKFRVLYEI